MVPPKVAVPDQNRQKMEIYVSQYVRRGATRTTKKKKRKYSEQVQRATHKIQYVTE